MPLDLTMTMDTMPLARVTVEPLSVSVTFGPLVPPPGTLAQAPAVAASHSATSNTLNREKRGRCIILPKIYTAVSALSLNSFGDAPEGAHSGVVFATGENQDGRPAALTAEIKPAATMPHRPRRGRPDAPDANRWARRLRTNTGTSATLRCDCAA